jgi:hypothetical protein
MANPIRRGESGSQVSSWMPSSNTVTPLANTSFILPYGLQCQQTINAGTTSVTIPAGITWVYVILAGGGGGGGSRAGGAGGIAWGWTLANSTCVVGAGGLANNEGGYTRYGHIIAGGGAALSQSELGGAGGGGGASAGSGASGSINYWGMPPVGGRVGSTTGNSLPGFSAVSGGGAGGTSFAGATAGNGGDGISGGGGGRSENAGSSTQTGGNGGNGLAGGAGGGAGLTSGTRIGGNGGNGINILTGAITTGGTGTTGTGTNGVGGGGGGIAGNGGNASGTTAGVGGLGGGGGGGVGGDGILYIFY